MDLWWRENRPAAKELFARELDDARRLLAATPELGSPYVERGNVVVRRLLLRKTQSHVYYEIDRSAGVVMILAVWGAPKGEGPAL
jgi:plasmid stabilization system protein ParE